MPRFKTNTINRRKAKLNKTYAEANSNKIYFRHFTTFYQKKLIVEQLQKVSFQKLNQISAET